MNVRLATNTSTISELDNLSFLPSYTEQVPPKQAEISLTATFQPTNEWLGSLMAEKNYTELNAFFDSNYNNFIAKGKSYCSLNLADTETGKTDTETIKVVNTVEDNKLLELYIKKIDQDQVELRTDIRASEERTAKSIESTEIRMDNRLNHIEDLLVQNARVINEKFDKIDTKFDSLKTEAGNALRWNVGLSIATMIGIGAMVITVVVTFLQLK